MKRPHILPETISAIFSQPVEEESYLGGSTEKQAAWMWEGRSLVVGVVLSGPGPLAVVQALLCPLEVGDDYGPQRARPAHVSVRQQGEGAQLAP